MKNEGSGLNAKVYEEIKSFEMCFRGKTKGGDRKRSQLRCGSGSNKKYEPLHNQHRSLSNFPYTGGGST